MADFTRYKKCFGQCKLVRENRDSEWTFVGECVTCRLRGLCKIKTVPEWS